MDETRGEVIGEVERQSLAPKRVLTFLKSLILGPGLEAQPLG